MVVFETIHNNVSDRSVNRNAITRQFLQHKEASKTLHCRIEIEPSAAKLNRGICLGVLPVKVHSDSLLTS